MKTIYIKILLIGILIIGFIPTINAQTESQVSTGLLLNQFGYNNEGQGLVTSTINGIEVTGQRFTNNTGGLTEVHVFPDGTLGLIGDLNNVALGGFAERIGQDIASGVRLSTSARLGRAVEFPDQFANDPNLIDFNTNVTPNPTLPGQEGNGLFFLLGKTTEARVSCVCPIRAENPIVRFNYTGRLENGDLIAGASINKNIANGANLFREFNGEVNVGPGGATNVFFGAATVLPDGPVTTVIKVTSGGIVTSQIPTTYSIAEIPNAVADVYNFIKDDLGLVFNEIEVGASLYNLRILGDSVRITGYTPFEVGIEEGTSPPQAPGVKSFNIKGQGSKVPNGELKGGGNSIITQKTGSLESFNFFGDDVTYSISDSEYRLNGEGGFSPLQALIALRALDVEYGTYNIAFNNISTSEYSGEAFSLTNNLISGNTINPDITQSPNPNIRFSPLATLFTNATNYAIDTDFKLTDFTENFQGIDAIGFNNNSNSFIELRPFSNTSAEVFTPYVNLTLPNDFNFGNPFRSSSNSTIDELIENMVPSVIVSPSDFDESNDLRFLSSLDSGNHIKKVFDQSIVLSSDKIGVTIQNDMETIDQADVLQHIYNAGKVAKQQLHNFINGKLGKIEATKKWTDQLKDNDAQMYEQIVEKLVQFHNEQDDSGDHIYLAPSFAIDLNIQPTVEIGTNPETGVSEMDLGTFEYNVALLLTNAHITLGQDENCDQEAELGVILSEEEVAFIQKNWAEDSDNDGIIDTGYLRWLQRELHSAEIYIKVAMEVGIHESYATLNKAESAIAAATFFKELVTDSENRSLISNDDLLRNMNTGDLRGKGLLASSSIPINNDVIDSEVKTLSSLSLNETINVNFKSTYSNVNFKPLQFIDKTIDDPTNTRALNDELETSLAIVSNIYSRIAGNDYAAGIPHLFAASVKNVSGISKENISFKIRNTDPDDIGHFNVYRITIPLLEPGEEEVFYFEYTPVSTGQEKFEMRSSSQTLTSIEPNFVSINDVLNTEAYCSLNVSISDNIFNGENESVFGGDVNVSNTVETNASFSINGAQSIDFNVGFEADQGSEVNANIVGCNTIQNGIIAAIEN